MVIRKVYCTVSARTAKNQQTDSVPGDFAGRGKFYRRERTRKHQKNQTGEQQARHGQKRR